MANNDQTQFIGPSRPLTPIAPPEMTRSATTSVQTNLSPINTESETSSPDYRQNIPSLGLIPASGSGSLASLEIGEPVKKMPVVPSFPPTRVPSPEHVSPPEKTSSKPNSPEEVIGKRPKPDNPSPEVETPEITSEKDPSEIQTPENIPGADEVSPKIQTENYILGNIPPSSKASPQIQTPVDILGNIIKSPQSPIIGREIAFSKPPTPDQVSSWIPSPISSPEFPVDLDFHPEQLELGSVPDIGILDFDVSNAGSEYIHESPNSRKLSSKESSSASKTSQWDKKPLPELPREALVTTDGLKKGESTALEIIDKTAIAHISMEDVNDALNDAFSESRPISVESDAKDNSVHIKREQGGGKSGGQKDSEKKDVHGESEQVSPRVGRTEEPPAFMHPSKMTTPKPSKMNLEMEQERENVEHRGRERVRKSSGRTRGQPRAPEVVDVIDEEDEYPRYPDANYHESRRPKERRMEQVPPIAPIIRGEDGSNRRRHRASVDSLGS